MPNNPEHIEVKVEDLQVGDRVDLESCPFLKNHPTAEFEYAEVTSIRVEQTDCIAVMYEGIDEIGYEPKTVLRIRNRSGAQTTEG